jgi:hypothetical protein
MLPNKKPYQTPEADCLDLISEPVLINASGDTETYGKGEEYNESDFD